jgi:hypothetical protein
MKLRFTPRATDNISAVADFLSVRNRPPSACRPTFIEACKTYFYFLEPVADKAQEASSRPSPGDIRI